MHTFMVYLNGPPEFSGGDTSFLKVPLGCHLSQRGSVMLVPLCLLSPLERYRVDEIATSHNREGYLSSPSLRHHVEGIATHQ